MRSPSVAPESAVQIPPAAGGPAAPRAQTKELILATALRLFRERGYDETTMRAVAKEAGVSVGNAYYYFASKDHLVQGFYDRLADDHRDRFRDAVAGRSGFRERLQATLETWLDVAAPYHEFSAQLFKNATDPNSPLSPFSAESAPARDAMFEIYAEVLTGSDAETDAELAEMLPDLLWLYHLGIVVYWVYDRSPGAERTRRLVVRCTALVARLVGLSRFKLLRPVVREVKDLLNEFLLVAPAKRAGAPVKPR